MTRLPAKRLLLNGYVVAVLATLSLSIVQKLLQPVFRGTPPLHLFLIGVLLAAWYGGLRAGLLATGLSALASLYFIEPLYSWQIAENSSLWRIVLFVSVGGVLSLMISLLRQAEGQALREALRQKELMEQEMATRQWAERALRESEARFQAFMDNSPTVTWIKDSQGRYVYINKPCAAHFGIQPEDWLGKTDFELWPPEIAEQFRKNDQAILDRGETLQVTEETRTLHGEDCLWWAFKFPIRDAAGSVYAAGIAVDLTERQRAAEELRESEEFNRRIVESSWDCIKVLDLEGRLLSMNAGGQKLLDICDLSPFLHQSWIDFWQGTDREAASAAVAEAAAGGRGMFQGYCPTQKGVPKWWHVLITPIRNAQGQPERLLAISRDTTQDHLAAARIKESEAFTRHVLDNLATFVSVLTPDGTLLEANRAPLESAGLRLEDLRGRKFWETSWWSHSGEVQQQLRQAIEKAAQGQSSRYDTEICLSGGTLMPIDFMLAPLRDEAGAITHLISSAIPIGERKHMEHALREADRRKNEFLAMLGHELRNPLAPIKNAVQIMRKLEVADEKLCWVRDVVDRQVGQLTRLVDDLLDVSRIVQGKLTLHKTSFDLRTMIDLALESNQPLIEARHHDLKVSLPEAPLPFEGDFLRLAQMTSNLLNNAAKYTPEGGRIWLTVTREYGEVVISIRDTGEGIAGTLLPYLFDVFTQGERTLDRAQGGLGLGLTIVQNIVALHGGRVEARSEGQGRGSEFVVRLPVLGRELQPARHFAAG